MGFFSDLKADVSQAVNELLPEGKFAETPAKPAGLDEQFMTDEVNDASSGLQAEEAGTEDFFSAAVLQNIADFGEAEAGIDCEDDSSSDIIEQELNQEPQEPEPIEALLSEAAVGAGINSEQSSIQSEETGDNYPVDINQMLNQMLNQMEQEKENVQEEVYAANTESEAMKAALSSKQMSDETATITANMIITGDVTSEGSLKLEGYVDGNIDILGKLNISGCVTGDSQAEEIFADNARIDGEIRSRGSVKIGQSTVIIGNIFANSAVIAGAVKGDIDVHGPVILDTSAIVMGNIKAKSVQINNGAVIEGMCSQAYAEINPTSFFEEFEKAKK